MLDLAELRVERRLAEAEQSSILWISALRFRREKAIVLFLTCFFDNSMKKSL